MNEERLMWNSAKSLAGKLVRVAVMTAALMHPVAALSAAAAQQEFQDAIRSIGDPARGAVLFQACARCHGAGGDGNADGSVPAISGQHWQVIARQLVDYRHARRWDPRMEHQAGQSLANAQAIADVAAHVASLPRGNSIGTGRGDMVERGRGIHAAQCASCHGSTAGGDGAALVPRLARQHYAYLLRQFHDAVEGRRPNFPGDHVRLLERFQRDDLVGLADWLARVAVAPATTPAAR
jgi:cytochrome c553